MKIQGRWGAHRDFQYHFVTLYWSFWDFRFFSTALSWPWSTRVVWKSNSSSNFSEKNNKRRETFLDEPLPKRPVIFGATEKVFNKWVKQRNTASIDVTWQLIASQAIYKNVLIEVIIKLQEISLDMKPWSLPVVPFMEKPCIVENKLPKKFSSIPFHTSNRIWLRVRWTCSEGSGRKCFGPIKSRF